MGKEKVTRVRIDESEDKVLSDLEKNIILLNLR